jgi:hypothetical protein
VRKIRSESRSLGIVTIVLSLLFGFFVVWLGNQLPVAAHNPVMGIVIIAGLAADFCLLLSGVGTISGPKCVSTGYLDANSARKTRSVVLAMGIMASVFGAFSCGLLVLIAAGKGNFGLTTGLFMALPVLAVIIAGINYVVIRRLRPTAGPGPAPGPDGRW